MWSCKHSNPCCNTVGCIAGVYGRMLATTGKPSSMYALTGLFLCQRAGSRIPKSCSVHIMAGALRRQANVQQSRRVATSTTRAHLQRSISVQSSKVGFWETTPMSAYFVVNSGKTFRHLQCDAHSRRKICAAHYFACCISLLLLCSSSSLRFVLFMYNLLQGSPPWQRYQVLHAARLA